LKDCELIGTDHLGPHWKEMVAEAVSETDPRQLREKVAAAEAAIFQRLQRLATSSKGSQTEMRELRAASDRLLALKTDVLKFPGWREE
jgi:hypothetical protein